MSGNDSLKPTRSLLEFDAEIATMHMRGQWQYDALLEKLVGGPAPAGVPYLWKWSVVSQKLLEACDVLPESFTARRSCTFVNPALERGGTTQTLLMGVQLVKPGEIAWAHRHSIGAIRFVIQGSDRMRTVVDGEFEPMEPNDLILTPNWNWHDHRNESDQNGIWLDVLDVPLILGLNQAFYQPYGKELQPVREGESEYLGERARLVRPVWESRKKQNFPFRYRWQDVRAQLDRMATSRGSPYDGIVLEYVNPMTGGPTLPTLGCWIQLLRPGEATRSHRHTSSAVYFVVNGEGTTTVGDVELNWSQHDAFVVPNWMWHHHVNRSGSKEAILFSANDIPILQPLGLYREEPEMSLQMAAPPAVPADRISKV